MPHQVAPRRQALDKPIHSGPQLAVCGLSPADRTKASQRKPKQPAALGQSHARQFVQRETDQRRAQHRQQGHVLQRVVQQPEQVEQIRHFKRVEKAGALRVQRHIRLMECLRERFNAALGRTEQYRHVLPLHVTESLFLLVPDLMLLVAQFAQAQRDKTRLAFDGVEFKQVGARVVGLFAVLVVVGWLGFCDEV